MQTFYQNIRGNTLKVAARSKMAADEAFRQLSRLPDNKLTELAAEDTRKDTDEYLKRGLYRTLGIVERDGKIRRA